MSLVFEQTTSLKSSPSFLYIKDLFQDPWYDGIGVKAICVAYDLVFLERPFDGNSINQALVEFGYSVTDEADNFDRKFGRELAVKNLQDRGVDKSNYGMHFLGVADSLDYKDYLESFGIKSQLAKQTVPIRAVGNGENIWIKQADFNLTSLVQNLVLDHYMNNPHYN